MSTIVAHRTRVMRHKGITPEQVVEALKNAVKVAVPGNTNRMSVLRESILRQISVAGRDSTVYSYLGVSAEVDIRMPTRELLFAMGAPATVGDWGGVVLGPNGSVTFNLDHYGVEDVAEHFNQIFARELAIVDAAATMKMTQDEVRKLMADHHLDPDTMTEKDARRIRMASTLAAEFGLKFDRAFDLIKRVRGIKLESESDVASFRQALTTLEVNLPWIEREHLDTLLKKIGATRIPMRRLPLVQSHVVESVLPGSVIKADFVVSFGNNLKVAFRQVEVEVESEGKKTKHKVWQITGQKAVMEEIKPAIAGLRRIVSAWQPISKGLEHLKESKVVSAVELEVSRDETSVSVQLVGLDAKELSQKKQFVEGLKDRAKKGDQRSQQVLRDMGSRPKPISLTTYSIGRVKDQAFGELVQAAVAWQREV